MIALAALALLASPLTPGAPQDQAPSVARFALAAEPQSFDPLHSVQTGNQVLQRQVYEGLVEYSPGGADAPVQGLLAESWTVSANGRTWRFRLRADARFHDSFQPALWTGGTRPVRAMDVVQSWLRMADLRQEPRGYWAFDGLIAGLDQWHKESAGPGAEEAWQRAFADGVDGLRALDERTVEIRLSRSDPWFLQRLASAYFVVYPAEAVSRSGKEFLNQPVGSGPYRLGDWTPGFSAVLHRIPEWRGQALADQRAAATIEEIRFQFVADGSTRTLLFEQGEIDRLPPLQDAFARLVPEGQLAPELAERGVVLHVVDTPDLSMLCFNMFDPDIGEIPGDSLGNGKRRKLRQAIAHAFPYERWHRVIRNQSWGQPATGFLPPALADAAQIPPCAYRKHDLDAARRLLAEAGWENGAGAPRLTIELGGSDPVNQAIGTMFREAMNEIGLEVEVNTNTFPQLTAKMQNGEAQIFSRAWTLDWADPVNLLETFHGAHLAPGINRCNYASPAFDRDLDALRQQPTELRGPLLARAIARLNEDLPAIPIDHRRGYLLVQPWLKDVQVNPFDPFPCKYYRLEAR